MFIVLVGWILFSGLGTGKSWNKKICMPYPRRPGHSIFWSILTSICLYFKVMVYFKMYGWDKLKNLIEEYRILTKLCNFLYWTTTVLGCVVCDSVIFTKNVLPKMTNNLPSTQITKYLVAVEEILQVTVCEDVL